MTNKAFGSLKDCWFTKSCTNWEGCSTAISCPSAVLSTDHTVCYNISFTDYDKIPNIYEYPKIMVRLMRFPAELQLLLVPLVVPDGKTRERFFDAALRGEELILKSLLEEAIDPDTTGAFENTALHFAVGSSHVNVVRLLLEASADKDKVNLQRRNWTPLNFAAYAGDPDVLRLLLEARANPNGASLPLRQAVKMGHVAAAQMLLDAGSKIPDQSQRSESESSSDSESESMQLTATRMGNTEILRLLLEARANPDEKTHGASPLLAAAQQGHVAAAELLLQFGADKNQMAMMPSGKSTVPRTALSAACHTGRIGVVRLLLSVGASKEQRYTKGLGGGAPGIDIT